MVSAPSQSGMHTRCNEDRTHTTLFLLARVEFHNETVKPSYLRAPTQTRRAQEDVLGKSTARSARRHSARTGGCSCRSAVMLSGCMYAARELPQARLQALQSVAHPLRRIFDGHGTPTRSAMRPDGDDGREAKGVDLVGPRKISTLQDRVVIGFGDLAVFSFCCFSQQSASVPFSIWFCC